MADPVRDYLAAIVAHDWGQLAALVHPDVVRVGPYGDTFTGRGPYVEHLASVMPSLQDYGMDVARVTYSPDGRLAFAELTETVTVQGRVTVTAEVLVLTFDEQALVTDVSIYTRRVPG
jgi:ketosteroid isomerase-like protein